MKISIDRATLLDELFKLQGVVSQRSTLAILSNALLDARDGSLTLHATDLTASISTSCPCTVHEPGRVTLQARGLFDIVKNLEHDELVLAVQDNYWTQLTAGAVSCRIVGTHPDDFPDIPNTDSVELYPIGTERMLDMIDKTLFSVSTDDARANLTGAFFRITEEHHFLMVSTDGHRLSKIESVIQGFQPKTPLPDALSKGIIVPRKGLSELKRTLHAKTKDLSFGLIDNAIVFHHGNTTLSVLLIKGAFPDLTQVLPKESQNKAVIDRDTFTQSLKFVSLFASPKTHNVRLSLSDEGLELYASDPDKGEGKKLIDAKYDGPPVKAGYNYRYLLDVLSVLQGDEVSLEIIDTLSPTLARDATRPEMLFIVMPMRL